MGMLYLIIAVVVVHVAYIQAHTCVKTHWILQLNACVLYLN